MLPLLSSLVITAAAAVAILAIVATVAERWPRIAEVVKGPGRGVGMAQPVPTPSLRQRRSESRRPITTSAAARHAA